MLAAPRPTTLAVPGRVGASRHPSIRALVTTPRASRPGGVGQYLRAIRPHLPDTVRYFTVGSCSDGEGISAAACRILRDSWRFARELRSGGYDVVHLNPSIGPKALLRDGVLLVIAKIQGKAVIVFVHGWDDNAFGRLLSSGLARMFRLIYGRADAFIVLGSAFEKGLRQLGCAGPVFLQGAPVEDGIIDDFERAPAPKSDSKGRSTFNILFLARVEREKGIYEALDTYRILKRKHPSVSLTVAGRGSELGAAVRYASTLGITGVSFIGHVERAAKHEAYETADAYLFPSYSEGLPISVLEAMACGLPVVTCGVGGLPDFFQDGTMGFMTKGRDPEVLAGLLSHLISNPSLRLRMSLFNRKYAREHFNASQLATRLEQVYRFVLDGAR